MQKPTLDKYGFPVGSPISPGTLPPVQTPWQWGMNQKIQTRAIKVSRSNIKSFQQQKTGTFASGTFADGGTLFLSSVLTPNPPHANEPMMGIAYAGVFLGTQATNNGQLYPVMGTANGTMFPMQGGLDFQRFDGTQPNWRGYVINHSGAAATIGLNVTWQYLWFNSGTVS